MYNLLQKLEISDTEPGAIIDKLLDKRKELIASANGVDPGTASVLNKDIQEITLALNSLSWASGTDISERLKEVPMPETLVSEANGGTAATPASAAPESTGAYVYSQAGPQAGSRMDPKERLRLANRFKLSFGSVLLTILVWIMLVLPVAPAFLGLFNSGNVFEKAFRYSEYDDETINFADLNNLCGKINVSMAKAEMNSPFSGTSLFSSIVLIGVYVAGVATTLALFMIPLALAAKIKRNHINRLAVVTPIVLSLDCIMVPLTVWSLNNSMKVFIAQTLGVVDRMEELDELLEEYDFLAINWPIFAVLIGVTVLTIVLKVLLDASLRKDYKKSEYAI